MAPNCPQQYTHPRAWTKQLWVGWRAKPHTWCIQTGIRCFHFNLHLRVTCPHKSLDKLLFHVLPSCFSAKHIFYHMEPSEAFSEPGPEPTWWLPIPDPGPGRPHSAAGWKPAAWAVLSRGMQAWATALLRPAPRSTVLAGSSYSWL